LLFFFLFLLFSSKLSTFFKKGRSASFKNHQIQGISESLPSMSAKKRQIFFLFLLFFSFQEKRTLQKKEGPFLYQLIRFSRKALSELPFFRKFLL